MTTSRAALDRYDSPSWVGALLLDRVPELRGECLLDPSSGNGKMASGLSSRFARVICNDVDATTPAELHLDASRAALWRSVAPTWTASNPPFFKAAEILELALSRSFVGVALFLRLSFLEVCKGRGFLARYPPKRLIVAPRIRFRGASTDKVTCAWFVWSGASLSGPPIETVSRSEIRRLIAAMPESAR